MVALTRASGTLAVATVLALLGLAGPAAAGGRDIQYDRLEIQPVQGVAPCRLGQADCQAYHLGTGSELTSYLNYHQVPNPDYMTPAELADRRSYDPEFYYDPTTPQFIPSDKRDTAYHFNANDTFYVYKEGVVSFGAPLPTTASWAGGTASLGDGNWFAPAFGEMPIDVNVYYDGAGFYNEAGQLDSCSECYAQWRIDWRPGIATPKPTQAPDGDDPDAPCPEHFGCPGYVDPRPYLVNYYEFGLFQLFIESDLRYEEIAPHIQMNYLNGVVPTDRIAGFNYKPYDDDPYRDQAENYISYSLDDDVGLIGPAVSRNTHLLGPGVQGAIPEPAAWTLMLLGFGGLGSVLRRRQKAALTV